MMTKAQRTGSARKGGRCGNDVSGVPGEDQWDAAQRLGCREINSGPKALNKQV